MTPIDLTKVLKKSYVGKWVALSPDMRKVFGVGDSIQLARDLAERKGCSNPILHKVLPFDQGLAPGAM